MSATAPTLQRRGNRKAFLIAGVFGLLAAILTFMFLGSQSGSQDSAPVTMVPVLVATKDIPERTVIKESMIEVKQVPSDVRLNTALTDRSMAVGALSRGQIAAGEQVLRGKIADQVRDVGFSANIPQGKRGVAVGVTEVIASGGHIGVGDFVDIIGIFEVHDPNFRNPACPNCQSSPRRYYTTTVLQNVQVLAVADRSEPTIQKDGKVSDTKKKGDEVKTVTLAVTPEQANVLLQAETIGELRLSLRPFGDEAPVNVAPIFNDPGNWPTVRIGQ